MREDQMDPVIFEHGKTVLSVANSSTRRLNVWCAVVAERAGASMDWGYTGGRAVVKYIGNRASIVSAILAVPLPPGAIYRWYEDDGSPCSDQPGIEVQT